MRGVLALSPTLFLALATSFGCAASGDRALTAYGGRYADASLPEDILVLQPVTWESSELAALAYTEVLQRIHDERAQWEWEAQVAKHFGAQTHWEFNALFALRWNRYPWDEYVRTSFAVGDGISYATEVPPLEARGHADTGSTRVLNYILLEFALGLPSQPSWDLVMRIHHRSGIFGLIDGVDGGSNVIAVGLKYAF